jgi:hypothetical protein
MKIIFPMFIMLIAGLSLGAGSMTLYWSGVADHGFKAQAEWKRLVEKSNDSTVAALDAYAKMKRASDSFERTANECLTMVRSR